MVAQSAEVKAVIAVAADPSAKRLDDGGDLRVVEGLTQGCFLDVQDLSAQRKNRLVVSITPLFGGPASGVPFDDEEFAFCGIFFLAVCEFTWERGVIEDASAADGFARFPCGFARFGGAGDIIDDARGDRSEERRVGTGG